MLSFIYKKQEYFSKFQIVDFFLKKTEFNEKLLSLEKKERNVNRKRFADHIDQIITKFINIGLIESVIRNGKKNQNKNLIITEDGIDYYHYLKENDRIPIVDIEKYYDNFKIKQVKEKPKKDSLKLKEDPLECLFMLIGFIWIIFFTVMFIIKPT